MPNRSATTYLVRRRRPGPDHWAAAERLSDFTFPWLDRAAPRTEFLALHDDSWFIFRFDVRDEDLVLADGRDDREKVIGSDRAEIFFAANEALDPYYCLEVDPRGLVYDYRARHYRQFESGWSWPGLEVESVRDARGYTVTGRLPLARLADLDLLDPGTRTLRAGLYRAEFSHAPAPDSTHINENWISWIDPRTAKPDFHVPSSFGTLQLVP